MKNKQKLDGLQWIGVICFSLAFPVFMIGVINDTIEIYWVNTDSESKSLYWAGTFVAPETADEPYTWESANDKEKTGSALLASSADTKTFTYEKGEISYEASALGTTKTVRLEKAK